MARPCRPALSRPGLQSASTERALPLQGRADQAAPGACWWSPHRPSAARPPAARAAARRARSSAARRTPRTPGRCSGSRSRRAACARPPGPPRPRPQPWRRGRRGEGGRKGAALAARAPPRQEGTRKARWAAQGARAGGARLVPSGAEQLDALPGFIRRGRRAALLRGPRGRGAALACGAVPGPLCGGRRAAARELRNVQDAD